MEKNEYIKELLLKEYTYQAIGDLVGLSKERIRQIARSFGLQRFRLNSKKQGKEQEVYEKTKRRGGCLFQNGEIIDKDLLKACRHKFAQKQYRIKTNSDKEWDLEFSDIVWNKTCPILGIELDYYTNSRKENSPSFDRIDSSKGYTKDNVIIISWRANRIKNDGTAEEHQKIANFLKKLAI